MNRDEALKELHENGKKYCMNDGLLPKDKKGKGLVCPVCGSGSHQNGTGMRFFDKTKQWICFHGAETTGDTASTKCFHGDIIDYYMAYYGIGKRDAIDKAAAAAGLIITDNAYNAVSAPQRDLKDSKGINYPKGTKTAHSATETRKTASETKEPVVDYEDYYFECCKRCLTDQRAITYLQARGISKNTIAEYMIGFDPEWISPTVRKQQELKGNDWRPKPTARIILPTSHNHYVARAIDPEVKEYSKMNECGGGSIGIYNKKALKGASAVFVVEGIFDALSIIEAGGAAIALNSTSNCDLLIKELEKQKPDASFILCLDNDKAGKEATEALRKSLARLNLTYIVEDICNGCKDANEALVKDRSSFEKAVKEAIRKAGKKPDNLSTYIDMFMEADIARLKASADKQTGFEDLDAQSGGLYAGLYVIAATSSLGKTTFAWQLADNLAAAGQDVLFFSLEQSRLELVSKSLSRIIAKKGGKGVTSLDLRKGAAPDQLKKAAEEYKKAVGDRISVIEGNFRCDAAFIGETVRKYIRQNSKRPIVFIDYLQILQPDASEKNKGVRETVDHTITELKRLSRENDLTIFVISSVNRTNYLTPIDFESLKESGGIEYTADVIWGLQYECLNEDIFNSDAKSKIKDKRDRISAAKDETPRKIQLVCLKNRYGKATFKSNFRFYQEKDLFEQSDGFEPCKDDPFTSKEKTQAAPVIARF